MGFESHGLAGSRAAWVGSYNGVVWDGLFGKDAFALDGGVSDLDEGGGGTASRSIRVDGGNVGCNGGECDASYCYNDW